MANKPVITKTDYEVAGGNPEKIPAVIAKRREIAEARAKEADGVKFFGDTIEYEGITFYRPTMRHKWFMGIVSSRYAMEQQVLVMIAAYVFSHPAEKLNTKLYTEKLQGTLERNAFDFVCDLDIDGLIKKVIDPLMAEIKEDAEDDGDGDAGDAPGK